MGRVASSSRNKKQTRLVCPNCLREVGFRDYASANGFIGDAFAAITNFIECAECGYYGLPVEIRKILKKGKGKK